MSDFYFDGDPVNPESSTRQDYDELGMTYYQTPEYSNPDRCGQKKDNFRIFCIGKPGIA